MINKTNLTLGSLFSGSGGFELAGILAGVKPIWASEVDPFGIRVTTKRMPEVKHYGDVSVLNGGDLEPVDIITFGSPCQDLSIAGKRAGLGGSRSGLYMEAVRIIGEMLEATGGEYPKYCVFENVEGLLSSNKGEDFIACLDMIQDLGFLPDANILDAQFMGVPQRRKRVYITWVNTDYILRKRTAISESITLQLLTEILLTNLAGLLKAYGIELIKSDAPGQSRSEDGLRRRIKLFSLQKEDRLQMLQQNLDAVKMRLGNEQKNLDLSPGEDQTGDLISIQEDIPSENSSTESQSMNTGLSLKNALEESLKCVNESITSTWTRETIAQKICTCFQDLTDTLDVTKASMHSLEKMPMCVNFFEWVRYSLTEMRGYINAAQKNERGFGEVAWNDMLRSYEQKLSEIGEQVEQYLGAGGACEILSKPESLCRDFKKSIHTRQRTAGSLAESSGEAGISVDGYNGAVSDKASTLGVNCGMSTGRNGVMILNDQGGQRMDITEGVTNTLRAEAHHPPVVLDGEVKAAGFCTEHSAKSRSIGYEEEVSPTLRAGIVPAAMALQHNPTDSRIKIEEDGNVQTLCSRMGTGGNNVPLLMEDEVTPKTLKIRCGAPNGGKGPLIQDNLSATLATNNDQTLFVPFVKGTRPHSAQEAPDWKEGGVANTLNTFDIGETRCNELAVEKKPQACSWDGGQISPTLTKDNADGTQHMPDKDNFNCVLDPVEPEQTAFGISSYQSHAMLSDNPHAGIYEAKTSRTLDGRCNDPSCNQGGVCVVEKEKPVAFSENQRSEVRDLGEKSGCLSAEPGMKQQTFIAEPQEKEPTAFHVNTRRELVDLHGKSGALMVSQSDQMQTFVIQGSMIGRDDKNGPQGDGINEDVSFTLNTVDRHAVAAPEDDVYAMTTGSYMEVQKEKSPTLMARDYKDPTTVAPVPSYGVGRDAMNQGKNAQFTPSVYEELQPTMVAKGPGAVAKGEPVYTVRRLTPTECARLQGFPDWWTDNLGTENPTDEEIAFWTDVFETHRKVVTHASKPKTEKQIRKWLADPYSDNAAYRMWGNGICLNCALYVLSGIVWAEGKEE